MAETSEKNPGVGEIKIIVVRLPFDLQERLQAFPFLHALRERYPLAEFHFISPKKDIEVLNLLPFKAFYHEVDDGEIRTVFDVHRYCVHAKIYNVDLFVSLTNSFADASIGLSLRAPRRLGFSDNWKTLLFTEKTKRPVGHHLAEDFLELFRIHVGENVELKLRVMSRELPSVIPDAHEDPFIAINLTPMRNAVIDEDWIALTEEFEDQRIIFFSSGDRERVSPLYGAFSEKLSKNNRYEFFLQKDWIELGKFLAHARGVITHEGPAASVSAYVGAKTLILFDRRDPQREGPFYFLSDVSLITAKDSGMVHPGSGLALKSHARFRMDEIKKRAAEFFRL